MVWNIVLLIVMWLVGTVLGAFGLIQIMLCLFSAFPIIAKLSKVEAIEKKSALVSTWATIVLWTVLFSIAMFLLFRYGNSYAKIGMFLGLGISFFKGLSQLSPNNPNNIIDFLQSHTRCITDHSLQMAINENDPEIMIRVYDIVLSGEYAVANQSADDYDG